MLKKLMVSAVAGLMLVGATDVMARVVGGWIVVGLSVAPEGAAEVTAHACNAAILELRRQGFKFKSSTSIEPRLVALFYERGGAPPDRANVTLSCLANVIEEQDLFDPDEEW